MSIQAVSWVLEHSQSTGSARLVLISLANHASEQNGWECWPAARTIAREAGVKSHVTALAAVERLVDLGELEIVDRGSARTSARYRMTFQRSDSDQELTAAVSPDRPQRSVQTDQNRKEPEWNQKDRPAIEEQKVKGARSRRKPQVPIPEPFTVTDEMRAWVRGEHPALDWDSATKEFVAWCKSTDQRFSDWVHAWRNGMHRAARWHKPEAARTHL